MENIDNVIDVKKKLIEAIVVFLKPFYGKKNFNDNFVVWICNDQPQMQAIATDKDFVERLFAELNDNEFSNMQNHLLFKKDDPPNELKLSSILEGVFIQRISIDSLQYRITIANGKGILMESEYILDPTKQKEFNIGRGINNNHIVVVEDVKCSYIDVSSNQAKIFFLQAKGFFLQSRNDNNRTLIIRNNQEFARLVDERSSKLLKHGDVIELGNAGSVNLKFEQLAL